MNTLKCIIHLILIIICFVYLSDEIEPLFVPNETQFGVCNDNSGKGETNHQIFNNRLPSQLNGPFNAILKYTNELDLSKYFKPPQCFGSNHKNKDYFPDNKIIDHSDNDWEPLKDPNDKYYHPNDNYAILYNEKYIPNFLEKKHQNTQIDDRF